MWRQKTPVGDRYSDETLSDEDELDQVTYDNDCTKKLQSLISNEGKGQKLDNISSGCVMGINEFQHETHEFIPSLPGSDRHVESDDSISDEENVVLSKLSVTSRAAAVRTSNSPSLESEHQHEVSTWSAVIGEARELAAVPRKTQFWPLNSETSEARDMHNGDRGRAKPKFSFRPLPPRGSLSGSTALKDGNGKDATEDPAGHNKLEQETRENSVADIFGNLQEEGDELLMKVASHDQRGGVPSMSELLENLQQKDGPSMEAPNLLLQNIKSTERKTEHATKRILPHLGSRVLDDEDPPEYPGGGSSTEDEDNNENCICVATQKVKGNTMTDLFQEAFNISEMEGPLFPTSKQSGIGYHGRLQQVLQTEKDAHMEFLKYLQSGRSSSNDSGCMDVHILARVLEGKLTVCQCSFGEYSNGSQFVKSTNKCAADVGSRRTIIFNSKICDNVELEVGNFVRIHPPWKEVQVSESEKIILCMYFSPQIE